MFRVEIFTLTRGYDGEYFPKRNSFGIFAFDDSPGDAIKLFVATKVGDGDFSPKYLTNNFKWIDDLTLQWETKYYLVNFKILDDDTDNIRVFKERLPPFEQNEHKTLKQHLLKFIEDNPAVKLPRPVLIELGLETMTIYDAAPYLKHFK